MKRFYTIFVLSLLALATLFPCNSFSQSYSPLVPGNTAFYQGYYLYNQIYRLRILGARIDSIRQINSDTVYYLNKSWNLSDIECIRTNGNSWLGPYFTKSAGGVYHFFNKYGGSIELRPEANNGESWTMIDFGEAGRIDANIAMIRYEDFLGISDTVKYIGFNVLVKEPYQKKFENILGKSIAISRNHGFVKAVNFEQLNDSMNLDDFQPWIFELTGMTKPEVGKTFPTNAKIYDFELDDEFHYASFEKNYPYSRWRSESIRTVTGKRFSQQKDTVFYTFHVTSRIIDDDFTKNTTRDTIVDYYENMIYLQEPFTCLPYEPKSKGYPYYFMSINANVYNRQYMIPSTEMFQSHGANDSCWKYIDVDGAGETQLMEGIGLFYRWGGMGDMDAREDKLVYYKKGSQFWGTPLSITSVEESASGDFSIYPNPAANMILVNNPSNEKILLYSPEGVNLIESAPNIQIDISTLPPGIYFLRQGSRIAKFIKL